MANPTLVLASASPRRVELLRQLGLSFEQIVSPTEEPSPQGTDPEAWASCVAGAEDREVYLGRLRKAGFVDIDLTEEKVRFDEDQGIPLNVASVKVVARKPA